MEGEDDKKLHKDPVTGELVSKKELKKRERQRKKEKDKEEKNKKKEEEGKESKKKKNDEEELDPTKYFENRKTYLVKKMESGENPFPHKFDLRFL